MSTPSAVVVIHLATALGALALGPVALLARKGSRGHRAAGYAWFTLMLGAAISSVFILDHRLPNWGGYTAIHLLTLGTFVGLGLGLRHIVNGRVRQHRRVMGITYGGLVTAGLFAFLPDRLMGGWLQALV